VETKKNYISLDEIWPQERDYFSRPERFKYVRKIVKPLDCVFCSAQAKGPSFESLCLYKDDEAMVVLNKYPYNSGHILILPVRHCGDLLELGDKEYVQLSTLLLATVKILRKVYDTCQGFNIGMNHGKVAGAGIPEHLHWHLVPRWLGDTNFFPLIAETKVHPESLEQSFAKLIIEFKELKL